MPLKLPQSLLKSRPLSPFIYQPLFELLRSPTLALKLLLQEFGGASLEGLRNAVSSPAAVKAAP